MNKKVYTVLAVLEQETSGQIIDSQFAFWGNDSLASFPLELLAAEERLYFHFSQNACSPCIISTVEYLKLFFPNYEYSDAVVFISPDWPLRLRNDTIKLFI